MARAKKEAKISGFGMLEVEDGFYILHAVTKRSALDEVDPKLYAKLSKIAKKRDCALCGRTEWPAFVEDLVEQAMPRIMGLAGCDEMVLRSRCVRCVDDPPVGDGIDFISVFEPSGTLSRPPGVTLQ